MAEAHALAVIIPTHNRLVQLRECLYSIRRSGTRPRWVIVVDDASSDATAATCRSEFPEVDLVLGDGELWWGGCVNAGIRRAIELGAGLTLWLNDDNILGSDVIHLLGEAYATLGERAVVCARVRVTDSEPTGEWQGQPQFWDPRRRDWSPPPLPGPYALLENPPGGQGVLIPVRCYRDIGLVETRLFPHRCGDLDFHYRAMRAGYRYYLVRDAVVLNRPNPPRMEEANPFTVRWAAWYLLGRGSYMNLLVFRRLLRRILPASEYRATYYPLALRNAEWVAWRCLDHYTATRLIVSGLRRIKRAFIPAR